MMRGWKTEVATVGGDEDKFISTSYKTYTLTEASAIISQLRAGEQEIGKPKRKLKPISRYILEELIQQYFRKGAKRGTILEMITIEDTRKNGL
jgi:hypothetical protein